MKKLRLLGLFFGLVLVSPNLGWSQSCDTTGDGTCCDQDFNGGDYDPGTCFGIYGGPGFDADGVNSDVDCGTVDDTACIPLDGGLSLLALAGGGLATAAMRRRREEEEAAAQGAA